MGGCSVAVCASSATFCWTWTKGQNSRARKSTAPRSSCSALRRIFRTPIEGPTRDAETATRLRRPVGLAVRRLTADTSADRQAWERYCSGAAYTLTMFSWFDCSRYSQYSQHSQQLWELDWLIAEYSERIGDQRHVLSRLADHIGEAAVIQKFLEDLLSTQKFYLEERRGCLCKHAPSLRLTFNPLRSGGAQQSARMRCSLNCRELWQPPCH